MTLVDVLNKNNGFIGSTVIRLTYIKFFIIVQISIFLLYVFFVSYETCNCNGRATKLLIPSMFKFSQKMMAADRENRLSCDIIASKSYLYIQLLFVIQLFYVIQ